MNSLFGMVPLVVLCGLLYGNYRLVMWAKVKHPDSLTAGLLLCLLSPIGHLYLDNGGKWIVGLGLLAALSKPFLLPSPTLLLRAMKDLQSFCPPLNVPTCRQSSF